MIKYRVGEETMLKIEDLTVVANKKTILDNFNLTINKGEICALMGPNGVGKSTICKVLLNDPNYQIKKGNIYYNDTLINKVKTEDRAKRGIFLLNQTPITIPGVTNSEMLRLALSSQTNEAVDILKFHKELKSICEKLDIPTSFIHRNINEDMSGGERKKNELMHLWMLKPNFIILDEVDSGLDVDSFKIVLKSLKEYYQKYNPTILIITHNTKVFKYLKPHTINILSDGHIIKSGDISLAKVIDEEGYETFKIKGKTIYE